jgi:NAD(P)-dependent dehydrogenase (short-subunit alcohol dehydrogenase family)
MKNVFITDTENDFQKYLSDIFNREGYQVYTEPLPGYIDKIDLFLDTTDYRDPGDHFTVLDGINYESVERTYRGNILHSMALLEKHLPLLDAGEGKRLFYLTSAKASVNETHDINHFGYNMSKAALHQFIQLLRNKLAPKGYTFRVFDPMTGEIEPKAAAEAAFRYITRRRGTENHDPNRDDEDNLVFRDAMGRQHSW